MKLNACAKYKESNKRLLERLALQGYTIDRFGHAKKQIGDILYRYKFQHHTIRKEMQVIHEASGYSEERKEWVRLKTFKYKA